MKDTNGRFKEKKRKSKEIRVKKKKGQILEVRQYVVCCLFVCMYFF